MFLSWGDNAGTNTLNNAVRYGLSHACELKPVRLTAHPKSDIFICLIARAMLQVVWSV